MEHPTDNIFATISNHYYKLTASEKKVADYVFAHKTETQYMSISELADESGVADATISRFCRGLKLKGYHDFKLAIAKAVAAGGETAPQTVSSVPQKTTAAELDHDLAERCRQLYQMHVAGLNQTVGVLDPECVSKAVNYMLEAEHVYFMGQGGSMILALEAEQMFSVISPDYHAISDSHRQAACAATMKPKDVIVFFSYSGSTKDIVELARLVHEKGARLILITRFLKSPGGKQADVVLQCGCNEGPLQSGSAIAKIAQLYIVDVLYQELCRIYEHRTRENQEKIAKALAVKHL